MAVSDFLKYIQSEKRLSQHTIVAYKRDIEFFAEFIASEFDLADLTKVDHQIIRSWLVSLKQNELSNRSINRKLSSLKSLYKYFLRPTGPLRKQERCR